MTQPEPPQGAPHGGSPHLWLDPSGRLEVSPDFSAQADDRFEAVCAELGILLARRVEPVSARVLPFGTEQLAMVELRDESTGITELHTATARGASPAAAVAGAAINAATGGRNVLAAALPVAVAEGKVRSAVVFGDDEAPVRWGTAEDEGRLAALYAVVPHLGSFTATTGDETYRVLRLPGIGVSLVSEGAGAAAWVEGWFAALLHATQFALRTPAPTTEMVVRAPEPAVPGDEAAARLLAQLEEECRRILAAAQDQAREIRATAERDARSIAVLAEEAQARDAAGAEALEDLLAHVERERDSYADAVNESAADRESLRGRAEAAEARARSAVARAESAEHAAEQARGAVERLDHERAQAVRRAEVAASHLAAERTRSAQIARELDEARQRPGGDGRSEPPAPESEQERTAILEQARRDAQHLLREAERARATVLEDANRQSADMLREAERASRQIVTTSEEEAARASAELLADAQRRSTEVLRDAERAVHDVVAEATKQAEGARALLESAQRQSAEILGEAERASRGALADARQEAERLLRESERARATMLDDARREADVLLADAGRSRREAELARARQEHDAKSLAANAELESERARRDGQLQAERIVHEARRLAEDLVKDARRLAEDLVREAADSRRRLHEEVARAAEQAASDERRLREQLSTRVVPVRVPPAAPEVASEGPAVAPVAPAHVTDADGVALSLLGAVADSLRAMSGALARAERHDVAQETTGVDEVVEKPTPRAVRDLPDLFFGA